MEINWKEVLPGDTIVVRHKDAHHYYVTMHNDTPVHSIWERKNWIDGHTEKNIQP